jgi:xanthine dehydrogenase YagT iron-sulfur-binding subunit
METLKTPVTLTVNGQPRALAVEPRRTLLDTLREDLGLTGAKKVCDHGNCGACTVIVNGKAVYACLTLTVACQGKQVETIEGIGTPDNLHPIQAAFIACDAYQCGFCTPGQIMSIKACLDQNPDAGPDEIARAVSGNLCRCGAYPKIVEAGVAAAAALKGGV